MQQKTQVFFFMALFGTDRVCGSSTYSVDTDDVLHRLYFC